MRGDVLCACGVVVGREWRDDETSGGRDKEKGKDQARQEHSCISYAIAREGHAASNATSIHPKRRKPTRKPPASRWALSTNKGGGKLKHDVRAHGNPMLKALFLPV